ncbi:MAG: WecB/TagA/CpsF family glycosyltransferase [bacterium]|nr:WecB/TagA/CpsF family glycosyltransferase [bacterium]
MKADVLGVQINTEPKHEILELLDARLDSNISTFIVTPYSESLVAAQKDQEFRRILNAADFSLPDGYGVILASKFLTSPRASPISERVPGREFFWDLCALAERRGESVFLLGGYGDTPELVTKKLKEKFPNLKIAGIYNKLSFPRKRESRETLDSGSEAGMTEKVINIINSSNASFLFVALGPITQEKWIYNNLSKLRVKLVMGVGGTFDYIAGKKPLPPRFLASWGLEWLWRLATQPRRFWRITKGVFGLIWYIIRARI